MKILKQLIYLINWITTHWENLEKILLISLLQTPSPQTFWDSYPSTERYFNWVGSNHFYPGLLFLFSCQFISDSLRPHGLQHASFPVLHYLLEFAQVHVHWVSDAIQPSHPLSPSSPSAFSLSQHQGPFQCVGRLVLDITVLHTCEPWGQMTDLRRQELLKVWYDWTEGLSTFTEGLSFLKDQLNFCFCNLREKVISFYQLADLKTDFTWKIKWQKMHIPLF